MNYLKSKYKECSRKVNTLKINVLEAKKAQKKYLLTLKKVSSIESEFKKSNISNQIKYNSDYKTLKAELNKQKLFSDELEFLEKKLSNTEIILLKIKKEIVQSEKLVRLKKGNSIKKATTKKTSKVLSKKEIQNKLILSMKEIQNKSKVEKFKDSGGGLSTALTTKSSLWTVNKK